MNGTGGKIALLLGLLATTFLSPGNATTVWFTSPELRSAAEELKGFLESKTPSIAEIQIATLESEYQSGDWVLSIFTRNRSPEMGIVLTAQQRGFLETGGQESYVIVAKNGVRYLVGGGHRGTTYAVFRIEDQWNQTGNLPLSGEEESLQGKPSFRIRLGGAGGPHPELDYAQPIPSDYTWDDYARALASYGINTTPGIIRGENVPDKALRAWGIRKVLFVSAVPFKENQVRKWRAATPDEIKAAENPRPRDKNTISWGPCPSDPFGREVYTEWFRDLLQKHTTASLVVFYFGDWGATPGAECNEGGTLPERITSFIRTISEIGQGITPEVRILVGTRGLSAETLRALAKSLPPGSGFYFEEPSKSLLDPADKGYDPSLLTSETAEEYREVFNQVFQSRTNESIAAIGAGGTSWDFSPAIGMAPPGITYSKVSRLSENGVQNISFAMGGVHPWVYSPALEVFREMIWNPTQTLDETERRIASRDFREASSEVRGAWKLLDEAVQRFPNIGRAQRLEEFVTIGDGLVTRTPRVSLLKTDEWCNRATPLVPYLLESLPAVIRLWRDGMRQLVSAQELVPEDSYDTAKRIRDQVFWGNFCLRLLTNEYNVVRCLNIMNWIPEGVEPEGLPWREAFAPIYRDEIQNCREWTDLLFTSPQPEIRVERDITTPTALTRRFEQKIRILESLTGD